MSTVAVRCDAMIGADPEDIAKDLTTAGFNCQCNMVCKVEGVDMEYFHDTCDDVHSVEMRWRGDKRSRMEFERDPDKEMRHG